jgi:hypothetical protein
MVLMSDGELIAWRTVLAVALQPYFREGPEVGQDHYREILKAAVVAA